MIRQLFGRFRPATRMYADDAATLNRIAEEMRTYAMRWEDADELDRIADRMRRAKRPVEIPAAQPARAAPTTP